MTCVAWMSKHLIGIALAFAAVVPASYGFLLIHWANAREEASQQAAKADAEAYTQHSDIAVERRCRPLPAAERYKCTTEEESAANQGRHDAYDLEAQRESAIWMRYTGIATILGTAFGLLGIAGVLATFAEQRKTTRADLRPYVTVRFRSIEREGPKLRVHIRMKNKGKTPAHKLYSGGDAIALTAEQAAEQFALLQQLGGKMPTFGEPSPFTLAVGRGINTSGVSGADFDSETLLKVAHKQLKLYVYGTVYYEDVWGEKHETAYCFTIDLIVKPDPGGNLANWSIGVNPRWELAPFYNNST